MAMTATEREVAAKVLRAMGDPLRLGVIEALRQGPKNVTDLFRQLGSSQSMMSQQLQILENHGLILTRKEGTIKTLLSA